VYPLEIFKIWVLKDVETVWVSVGLGSLAEVLSHCRSLTITEHEHSCCYYHALVTSAIPHLLFTTKMNLYSLLYMGFKILYTTLTPQIKENYKDIALTTCKNCKECIAWYVRMTPKGKCIHIRQCTPACATTSMLLWKSQFKTLKSIATSAMQTQNNISSKSDCSIRVYISIWNVNNEIPSM